MRVGMYNRWLATLGGGEKHSLAIAEYLSQEHLVEVISHTNVSKSAAEKRFNLDLSKVNFKSIPERPPAEISPVSAEYDFFINVSHLDYFASEAPRSATLIYFPMQPPLGPENSLRRRIKLWFRDWLALPAFVDGLKIIDTAGPSFNWLVGEAVKIRLPALRDDYQVEFDICAQDPAAEAVELILDDEQVGRVSLPAGKGFTPCFLAVSSVKGAKYHDLKIMATGRDWTREDDARLGISRLRLTTARHRLYQILFERLLKKWGLRLNYYPLPGASIYDCLDTYDGIWANSEFTRSWIRNYWGRESEVLYPRIDTEVFRVAEKTQKILSVGRFFAGSHNKKHLVLIQAFRELVDAGLQGWELHLVGGRAAGDSHDEYMNQVYHLANGYPVVIHLDLPFAKLVDLYAESTIYWHASGYGEDEGQAPIKFEHFGITTVEAMASGCVPVVIGKGGQPEIVSHGENGFLWTTPSELKSMTQTIIQNPQLCQKLSAAAIDRSKFFDKEHFNSRLQKLLKNLWVAK